MKNFHELKQVETTSSLNGYPENLKFAYIGFDDWEELSKFIEENPEFVPIELTKRSGQALWTRQGEVNKPFLNGLQDYGDNYSEFDNTITEQEFMDNEVRPRLGDFEDLESLEAFVSKKKEVWEAISELDDNKVVITYLGVYYETIDKESLSFYHDCEEWAIGVIEK